MNTKTLLVSCATLGSGGAERVLSILSTPFADEYHRVIYVMWKSGPLFFELDDRVELVDIEAKSGQTGLLKKMLWFRKYVKDNSPDLVLSFLYPWSMKVIFSLLFTKFPIIVAERRDGRFVKGGWPVKALRHLLYLKTKGIVLQTFANCKHYGGLLKHKLKVIYNPISIAPAYQGMALRTPKKDKIVSVGRLRFEKNYDLLIDAFNQFVKSHPSYQLVIYGDGEDREKLTRQIKSLGLEKQVLLPGRTSQVYESISDARMFVLSSIFEGMPNALLEAMCVGLPCISTKVSGATELIKHKENGILVDVGNLNQLTDAMSTLADLPSIAETYAQEAAKVVSILNTEKISKEWVEYLNAFM